MINLSGLDCTLKIDSWLMQVLHPPNANPRLYLLHIHAICVRISWHYDDHLLIIPSSSGKLQLKIESDFIWT